MELPGASSNISVLVAVILGKLPTISASRQNTNIKRRKTTDGVRQRRGGQRMDPLFCNTGGLQDSLWRMISSFSIMIVGKNGQYFLTAFVTETRLFNTYDWWIQ